MQRQFVPSWWTAVLLEFGLLASLYFAAVGAVNGASRAGPVMPAVALGAAILGWWVCRCCGQWLEHRSASELALSGAVRELLIGLMFGCALFSLCAAAVAGLGAATGLGGLQITGLRWPGNFSEMLAVAILSGFYEEAIFRGVILRHLEPRLGSQGALGLTALLFGGIHLLNPGASLFAGFAIAAEAGILLGAAFLVTRRLWLAIGLHAAWNFTQGWVFSIPVSGTGLSNGLLVTVREGPDWLTGGAFGLEASLVVLVLATAAGLGLLHLAKQRGQVRPAILLGNAGFPGNGGFSDNEGRFENAGRQTKL